MTIAHRFIGGIEGDGLSESAWRTAELSLSPIVFSALRFTDLSITFGANPALKRWA